MDLFRQEHSWSSQNTTYWLLLPTSVPSSTLNTRQPPISYTNRPVMLPSLPCLNLPLTSKTLVRLEVKPFRLRKMSSSTKRYDIYQSSRKIRTQNKTRFMRQNVSLKRYKATWAFLRRWRSSEIYIGGPWNTD